MVRRRYNLELLRALQRAEVSIFGASTLNKESAADYSTRKIDCKIDLSASIVCSRSLEAEVVVREDFRLKVKLRTVNHLRKLHVDRLSSAQRFSDTECCAGCGR